MPMIGIAALDNWRGNGCDLNAAAECSLFAVIFLPHGTLDIYVDVGV